MRLPSLSEVFLKEGTPYDRDYDDPRIVLDPGPGFVENEFWVFDDPLSREGRAVFLSKKHWNLVTHSTEGKSDQDVLWDNGNNKGVEAKTDQARNVVRFFKRTLKGADRDFAMVNPAFDIPASTVRKIFASGRPASAQAISPLQFPSVSKHMTNGRAYDGGMVMDNWKKAMRSLDEAGEIEGGSEKGSGTGDVIQKRTNYPHSFSLDRDEFDDIVKRLKSGDKKVEVRVSSDIDGKPLARLDAGSLKAALGLERRGVRPPTVQVVQSKDDPNITSHYWVVNIPKWAYVKK